MVSRTRAKRSYLGGAKAGQAHSEKIPHATGDEARLDMAVDVTS